MFQVAIKTNETWLICGGRTFADQPMFDAVMSRLLDMFGCPEEVIQGGASGADTMGAEWARRLAIRLTTFPADWKTHGSAAGPIRNEKMLGSRKVHRVIAFPGGKGTADMLWRSKRRMPEITVIEIQAGTDQN